MKQRRCGICFEYGHDRRRHEQKSGQKRKPLDEDGAMKRIELKTGRQKPRWPF